MELIKKTTILFSPGLHRHLTGLAAREGVSLGELVRRACEAQYGRRSSGERLEAVRAMGKMSLPVGTAASMKAESVPPPKALPR